MTAPKNTQVDELAQQLQSFAPQPIRQPLMDFLSLAPTTSAPYSPKQDRPVPERRHSDFLPLAPNVSQSHPRSRHQSVSHLTQPLPLTHGGVHDESVAGPAASLSSPMTTNPKTRRSSSMSSDGSTGKGRVRYLKLGPVHWGEHQGDHKEDWHDIDEEAISP